MKKIFKIGSLRRFAVTLAVLLAALSLTGCDELAESLLQNIVAQEAIESQVESQIESQIESQVESKTENQSENQSESKADSQSEEEAELQAALQEILDEYDATAEILSVEPTEEEVAPQLEITTIKIDEDGSYDSKDEVALYLHTYHHLPKNYVTKTKAKKAGWSGGSLEDYFPGCCIGGGGFGNNEGLLPEGKDYRECDIDTLGKSSRGAKRIVYSDDGYIYYTDDHYESFETLYEGWD